MANGFSLPDVPNELSNLTEIERRLISLHIPFMKILVLHRAGSHFKINGSSVNVPTTLSRVCELLPRLPDEAQLIPMKLKQKIEYKDYHMYGSIRKEVVMNAVNWLRENNEHYKDIELNDLWDDEWMQSELDTLLQPTRTEETQIQVFRMMVMHWPLDVKLKHRLIRKSLQMRKNLYNQIWIICQQMIQLRILFTVIHLKI